MSGIERKGKERRGRNPLLQNNVRCPSAQRRVRAQQRDLKGSSTKHKQLRTFISESHPSPRTAGCTCGEGGRWGEGRRGEGGVEEARIALLVRDAFILTHSWPGEVPADELKRCSPPPQPSPVFSLAGVVHPSVASSTFWYTGPEWLPVRVHDTPRMRVTFKGFECSAFKKYQTESQKELNTWECIPKGSTFQGCKLLQKTFGADESRKEQKKKVFFCQSRVCVKHWKWLLSAFIY